MRREDIIRMAREAGLFSGANEMVFSASLERFAALVAAAEREACAKVCEGMARPVGDEMMTFAQWIVSSCAAAIRSRGEVKP